MAHSAPSRWQAVQVSAAANEPGSRPSSLNSRTNTSFSSDLKRLGASLSWKSWRSSKSRTGSGTSLSTLSACNHGWKPYTMRKRVLVPIAIWTAALAAVIEILAQRSIREGGLSLSRAADEIPDIADFKYEFLPTIIAVILSIAWTWVDLDVKRIQPWLEMSKEGGAKVQSSLGLEYPYDFVALVPFKAAKRRHWAVFTSGTVMVLIFWVITPLQGAIFGKGPIQLRESATFYVSQDLSPIHDQSKNIDTSVLQHLYAIKYLNQSYPPFTTPQYALRPFKLETDSRPGAKNWTATTTKFWADINCHPAQVTPTKWPQNFDFENGKGCNASSIESVTKMEGYEYRMHYLGWHNSAYASQYIQRPTCSQDFANSFLAITAKGDIEEFEMTALFCETSYWKQRVSVTVPDTNFRPDNASITPAGPVEELPVTEFNSTGLEYLMGSSVSADQDASRDYRRNLIVNQYDRLKTTTVETPLDTMVAFAIGGMERPLNDYLDATVIEETYRAVHKATFALAYNSLLTEETASKEKSEGSVELVMHGVIVSRAFSALVEALLLTVAVSCIILLVLSSRMKSNLSTDPAALGDQMAILRNSYDLLSAASHSSGLLEEDTNSEPGTARLHLWCGCQNPSDTTTISVTGLRISSSSTADAEDAEPRDIQSDPYNPVSPVILRWWSGFVFTVLLIAALAGLLALRLQEQNLGGLPRPTEQFEVLQLLENYIPTAIATFIEPYWVLVNRMLCVFQPYDDLRQEDKQKGSRPGKAMKARYASRPPQVSILSALRSGHLVLSVVCMVSLLGNVLAVGLGGLFNEETTRKSYAVDLQFAQSHQFDITQDDVFATEPRANDNWFAVTANVTLDNWMPPWVVAEYYFQPFATANSSPENSTESFSGRTRGYGLDMACDEMKPFRRDGEVDIMDFRPVKERRGASGPYCPDFYNATWFNGVNGTTAVEGSVSLCDALFVFWGRSAQDPARDRDMRYYTCTPTFQTALFDVSVDAQGHVLSHKQVGGFDDNLGYEDSRNHTDSLLKMSTTIMSLGNPNWHNDTFSTGWYSDIIKTFAGKRFLDPAEPLPKPSDLLPLTAQVWKRSFAYMLASPDVVKYAAVKADQPPFTGTRSVTETRIFMSDAAFIVVAVIFGLYIVVATVLYGFSIKLFLPRMPTSIGVVLRFTAASRAVREYSPRIDEELRFGRYIGLDRRKHTGIEYSELVMPVDPPGQGPVRRKRGRAVRQRCFGRRREPVVEERVT